MKNHLKIAQDSILTNMGHREALTKMCDTAMHGAKSRPSRY